MRRIILLPVIFIFISVDISSQDRRLMSSRLEVSGDIGIAGFFGNFGSFNKDHINTGRLNPIRTGFKSGVGMKYYLTRNITAKINFSVGAVSSDYYLVSNGNQVYTSGTLFMEPMLAGEYYFIRNRSETSYHLYRSGRLMGNHIFNSIDIYGFSGIGGIVYNANPAAELEPHFPETGGFAFVLPLGAGLSYSPGKSYKFGLEAGGRYVFGDILKGYSAISSSNDLYYFLNLTFACRIKTPGS